MFGGETAIYQNEPCLLVPFTPDRAALAGLNIAQRGYAAFFMPTRFVTHNSAGQAYQEVRIEVKNSAGTLNSYMAMGPQQRLGEDFEIDDMDHVEVPVVRRESA